MDPIPDSNPYEKRPARTRRRKSQWSVRLTPLGVLIVFSCNLVLLTLLAWPVIQTRLGLGLPAIPGIGLPQVLSPSESSTSQATERLTQTFEVPSVTPDPPTKTATMAPPVRASLQQGIVILALEEGDHSHLFAYQPLDEAGKDPLPLMRLTYGPWNDRSPAVSPDGRWIAFVSDRNGYWDLYLLDLSTGAVSRLTDTLAYEGSPSWSPDGLWLVYEAYVTDNLDIFILSREEPQSPPIQLTSNPAADHSPAWSPQGRQVAFVSDRSGEPEIWLADLDQADEFQFRNLSQSSFGLESNPAWSPEGNFLAWASVQDGFHQIMLWDAAQTDEKPFQLGSGDWPAWSPDGKVVLAALFAPNQNYLSAFPVQGQGLVFAPITIPGFITGLAWADILTLAPLHDPFRQAAEQSPTPLWLPVLTQVDGVPGGRRQLVELDDVQVPYPYLQDLADESFQSLRSRVASEIGWDFLGSLENAYVPLTAPLDPGMGNDWLYTGRAIAVNTAPLNANWMVVIREDFGALTYWRVFLRARFQDGSAGMPLKRMPWDFNARFQGDPASFEQGGRLMEAAPQGYWFDFTALAQSYGWERLPALSSWRASYTAGRFNEFVLLDGLDWTTAMLEIYPPEALITPTRIVPPTRTPTPTPRFYQSPTPTSTYTPRPTLTPEAPQPSFTPSPSPTRTPTSSPDLPAGSQTPTQTP